MSLIEDLRIAMESINEKIDETDIDTLKKIVGKDKFDRNDYEFIRKAIRNLKSLDKEDKKVEILWDLELKVLLNYSYIKLPRDKKHEIKYTDDLLDLYNKEENKGYLQSYIEKVVMLENKSYDEVIKWIKEEKKKLNNNIETKKKQ